MTDPTLQKLLGELNSLACEWDQFAGDRHRDGMEDSAEALRGCRDELKAILRRYGVVRAGRLDATTTQGRL